MMQHLTNSTARAFALEWVAAWNAHDIERVLSHYAEDVAFHSPFIAIFADEASGHLLGKAALRTYWAAALEKLPDLRFELLDVLLGAGSLTVYYRGHRGWWQRHSFLVRTARSSVPRPATPLDLSIRQGSET